MDLICEWFLLELLLLNIWGVKVCEFLIGWVVMVFLGLLVVKCFIIWLWFGRVEIFLMEVDLNLLLIVCFFFCNWNFILVGIWYVELYGRKRV